MSDDALDFMKRVGMKKKKENSLEELKEYEEWTSRKVNESILDPVKKTLPKDIWRGEKMITKHREYILDTLKDWLEKMDVEDEPDRVVVIGSSTGFQYTDNSDIDVNVVLDISDSKIEELVKFLPNEIPLPGTKHPVNYYISKDADENIEKKSSAYDLLNDKWIKKPSKDEVEIPYGYIVEIARFFMDGIQSRISEYERDKIEYELYKGYREDSEITIPNKELDRMIEQKRMEIFADLDAIYIALKIIKSFRGEAFDEEYEPDFLIDIKTSNRDFSINNMVYKALERFGYLDKLSKYKEVRKKILDEK